MKAHLYHVGDKARTVFHQAARRGRAAIFRILIERWPGGVNVKDKNGDSPLQKVIYNNQRGSRDTAQTIREILAMGAADVTGRDDADGTTPLCLAIRQGNVELCRVLVINGSADMTRAIEVDAETGSQVCGLQSAVSLLMTFEEQGKMLMELCSLLPRAVSTEHLFW
jgi:ankyrin repeat protein